MVNFLVVWKITEKWLQNLYFHRYDFNMIYKLFSYLASLSRKPGKSVTPTFGNINLTETMLNLLVAWKFNQKWRKKFLLSP